jgi:hypothetical protein
MKKKNKEKGPCRWHQRPHRNYKRKQKRRYEQKRTYSNEEEESKDKAQARDDFDDDESR